MDLTEILLLAAVVVFVGVQVAARRVRAASLGSDAPLAPILLFVRLRALGTLLVAGAFGVAAASDGGAFAVVEWVAAVVGAVSAIFWIFLAIAAMKSPSGNA